MTNTKDNFPDPTDRASLETDRNFLLRLRDRERKLIEKSRKPLRESIMIPSGYVRSVEKISLKKG